MKKIFVYLLFTATLLAQEDIFDDPFATDDWEMEFEVEETGKSSSISDVTLDLIEESIGFSGQLSVDSNLIDYKHSSYFNFNDIKGEKVKYTDKISSLITGNFFLDIRSEKGTKAYGSFEVSKNANSNIDSDGSIATKELFVDFNFNNKSYLRVGQQNLAWGRGYFFNPTDLVNYEKKNLENLSEVRQGSFGIKLHIPRGVSKNFYAYVNLDNVVEPKDLALNLKYEFLVKNSEYSASLFLKKDYQPELGLDYSSGIGGANIFAEALIVKGNDYKHYDKGTIDTLDDELVIKASLGYQKSFDYKDEDNKITLIQEFYYNSIGYDSKNIGKDYDVFIEDAYELFTPYDFAYYYLFNNLSINEFLSDDLTLNLSTISSLSDNSHSIKANLDYKIQEKLSLSGSYSINIGEDYREMTIYNIKSIASVGIYLSF